MFKKENQKVIKIAFGVMAVFVIASMLLSTVIALFYK